MRGCVPRGAAWSGDWAARWEAYRQRHPDLAAEFSRSLAGDLPDEWWADLPIFETGTAIATRQASARILDELVRRVPELAGGSADLSSSTGVNVTHGGVFGPGRRGRSFHWGVREHGMAAALNGMAAHGGVRPYGSTFLVFADYMKPSIRLAAMMGLPVIYVFTHDSIGVGEDGPTHQPIEQLAMLRGIPNLVVLRPGDANETAAAWRVALARTDGPTALVLTRQKLPVLDRAVLGLAKEVRQGGYILYDPPGNPPDVILIATGSEVGPALAAAQVLTGEQIPTRVVSLPSWELFEAQPAAYRDEVLPPSVRARVSVEAASPFGWLRWTTEDGGQVAMTRFGASAPGERLFEEFGFTAAHVAEAARRIAGRKEETST